MIEDTTTSPQDPDGPREVRLVRGRFEAQFDDVGSAKAAARDARAVGFHVDVRQVPPGWLIEGRRQLPFPADERDRYASRFQTIATLHRGTYGQFVEEPLQTDALEQPAKGRG